MSVNFAPKTSYASSTSSANSVGKTKMDPVTKGALIGAGVEVAAEGIGLLALNHVCKNSGLTLKETLSATAEAVGGKGKLGLIVAGGIGLCGLIGAGIGKLVKNHQEKKTEQTEQKSASQQVDTNA